MAPRAGYLERATELSATMAFDSPDLRDTAGRTERLADQDLLCSYFDTLDLWLWSTGITLPHRRANCWAPALAR